MSKELLPKRCIGCTREQLERMGIVFLGDADDLFVFAKLPDGWEIIECNHYMWSELLDADGIVRARIFYKSAEYDRFAAVYLPY